MNPLWLKNDIPPHLVLVFNIPEVREAAEREIRHHIDLCAECHAWAHARETDDFHHWIWVRT